MRSPIRLHIKAKKFAVHLSDEPMGCQFPINCLCSTCRRTLIPSRGSANRKLPSSETRIGPEKSVYRQLASPDSHVTIIPFLRTWRTNARRVCRSFCLRRCAPPHFVEEVHEEGDVVLRLLCFRCIDWH